jgi:ligand-binding sensor domain-containing protein/serine phosphatase RsbU (regulator of sigma subunit)
MLHPYALPQKIQFDNYSTKNGLPSNVIRDIIQDEKGYLWFATQIGVSRFDGYHFANMGIHEGLPSNEAEGLMEDSRGNIWVGTYGGGVACYQRGKWAAMDTSDGLADNRINRFFEDATGNIWCYFDTHYETGISIITADSVFKLTSENGLSSNIVTSHIIDREGNIWLGTAGGINIVTWHGPHDYSIKNQLTGKIIHDILQDSRGQIWVATQGDGIIRLASPVPQTYSVKNGLPGNTALCLFEVAGGMVWAGFYEAGAGLFVNDEFRILNEGSLRGITINRFLEDNQNRLWAFTLTEGVYLITSNSARHLTTLNNLPDDRIWAAMKDDEGNIWLGSKTGITKFGKKPFEIYDAESGLPDKEVLCVYADNEGNTWGGTYSGLFRISVNQPIRSFTEKDGLPEDYLTVLKIIPDHSNNLWLGTYFGVTGMKKNRFITYPIPSWVQTSNAILDMAVDSVNRLWIASESGISVFSKGTYYHPPEFSELAGLDIRALAFDPSWNLWICTAEGIYVYGDTRLFISTSEGLSNKSCNDISIDASGTAWVATDNGLNQITLMQGKLSRIRVVSMDDGLLSNIIMFAETDHSGFLWTGHENGISRINTTSLKIRTFSDIDGFMPLETYQKAVSVDQDNNVWIGTVNGLVKYNPGFDIPQPSPPRLYITGIKFYNDSADIQSFSSGTDSLSGLPKELALPYHKNNLIFEYVGLHFANTPKNRYQYRLEGYDEKWSEITGSIFTHPYQKLPKGEYIFSVKASNCDGIWSEPVSFSFIITPPFWKTLWFYALEVFAGISLIYLFVRLRVRKLQHDKKILAQKVKERTLEIERQRDHIAEINREITDSIVYAQRIQSAVLPDEDTMRPLLKDYFILFKPRDIVSGDFYWVNAKGNKTIVVAADCTGHGVPGAFMSMLGVSLLNEIIASTESHTAADILNQLRINIKSTLSQTGKRNEAKDGMDLALCIIDTDNRLLQYAGAYNPLLVISGGEMTVYKADKMPIGIHIAGERPFTNHKISIQQGDLLYMFSDGYADQFGGPEYRKFKSGNFRDLLLHIHQKPMSEQKEILEKTIEDWKGEESQIDDIMVMGIRLVISQ